MEHAKQIRTGTIGQANMTVSELAALWLRHHVDRTNKKRTYDSYCNMMDLYVFPSIGGRRIRSLGYADGLRWAEEVMAKAAQASNAKSGRPAAAKTITVTKGMFNWAVKAGALDRNPFAAVTAPKHAPDRSEGRYAPTPEHVAVLRAIIRQAPLPATPSASRREDSALVVALLGYEGFRQEDVEHSLMRNALFAGGQVREAFEIYDGKTRAAAREPELWRQVRSELAELAGRRNALVLDEPLIRGERGGAFRRRNWQRDVWRHVKEIATVTELAAVPDAPQDITDIPAFITPHMLRRCAASMMAYADIETMTVRDHLGHENDTTTLRFYQKPFRGGGWRRGMTMEAQIDAAENFAASPSVQAAIEAAVERTTLAGSSSADDS
jgi:integrase